MLRRIAIGLLIIGFVLSRPQGLLAEEARVSRFAPRGDGGGGLWPGGLWARIRGQLRGGAA